MSNKRKPQSRGRIISNLNEVVREIEDIPGVKLTVQEFSKIPFKKQVALAHSAGVFVSMHGMRYVLHSCRLILHGFQGLVLQICLVLALATPIVVR